MKKKRLLFTGGGGAGNEAIWRLLSHKYDLYFVDADIANIDPKIPDSIKFKIPLASSKHFCKSLIALCEDLRIDVLIPSVDEELTSLANTSPKKNSFDIMLPHKEYVSTMLDKLTMIRALQDKHLDVPETKMLSEDIANFNYPCIIKPRSGRGSRGVFSVKSREEVESYKNKIVHAMDSYVIQQQKFGSEYTVQMIANHEGKLIHVVPIKVFSKKGVTIKARIDKNEAVMSACRLVHENIPSRGTYNIQLILTDEDNVFPFEINPRISTTFCLAIAAGIDPIEVYINGVNSNYSEDFKNQKQLNRHWHNHFS